MRPRKGRPRKERVRIVKERQEERRRLCNGTQVLRHAEDSRLPSLRRTTINALPSSTTQTTRRRTSRRTTDVNEDLERPLRHDPLLAHHIPHAHVYRHSLALSRLHQCPREPAQHLRRLAGPIGEREVQLGDFVVCEGAGVLGLEGDGEDVVVEHGGTAEVTNGGSTDGGCGANAGGVGGGRGRGGCKCGDGCREMQRRSRWQRRRR
jgi:hypothetical protein